MVYKTEKEKMDRVKDLMGKLSAEKSTNERYNVELTKYGPDNKIYGILKEGQKYYIKSTDKKNGVLLESDFYTPDSKNPTFDKYNTYEAAITHLNFKFIELCKTSRIENKINVFENDNLIGKEIIVSEKEGEPTGLLKESVVEEGDIEGTGIDPDVTKEKKDPDDTEIDPDVTKENISVENKTMSLSESFNDIEYLSSVQIPESIQKLLDLDIKKKK